MKRSQITQSLRPLMMLLRFLGVDLISEEKSSKLIILYSSFCLLLNVAGQLDVLFYLFKSRTELWNVSYCNLVIDYVNFAIQNVGGHLILLFFFRRDWDNLIQSLFLVEDLLKPQFFIKLHRVAWIGSVSLIFWVLQI